ncbi:MAG TPA: MFS transporter [Acidocella sp.]|jgi:ACS family tartrate transporter-like MFS transporter|uniref:MFS transporter n=1 Tax=Acidocella sp. TaxID=50710 RepID=UPI002C316581|nr:MFS transporter [Acidocella sp.]HVE21508.1 MFS transporter [Acidocella sp.]
MDLEARTIGRVTKRLMPFLILCYFVAYLDRVNVGFAALSMNKDLGFTATVFGFGAGIFFIAYFFFEVPSNLLLDRVGARRWIARIMFSWGIVAGAEAFIPQISHATGLSPATVFVTLRVLLGVAEAGFFPGIIFYLTIWFPALYRARMIGMFMAAIPLSTVVGGPISGMLLYVHGFGLANWQWLYLLEAIPALLLSFVVLNYLTDRPKDAKWLSDEERAWLVERHATETRIREKANRFSALQAITNTRVVLLAFIYFGINAAVYGLSFFMPQIVHSFGLSFGMTGVVTTLPYIMGIIGMVFWSRHSDRSHERREHVGLALLIAGLCIAGTTVVDNPVGKMILFTIAGFGMFGSQPCFWALPATFLSGPAAAAGLAAVNSLGNLSGFFGPYVMGKVKDATGSYTIALLAISVILGFAMLVALSLQHDHKLENPALHEEEEETPVSLRRPTARELA